MNYYSIIIIIVIIIIIIRGKGCIIIIMYAKQSILTHMITQVPSPQRGTLVLLLKY
jgi:hypothetical protein